jgi:AcrR family transcriptional regulator
MVRSERKEREFNMRRAEILRTAEKIFAAKSFHDVTMAEIANASGFSTGSLSINSLKAKKIFTQQ